MTASSAVVTVRSATVLDDGRCAVGAEPYGSEDAVRLRAAARLERARSSGNRVSVGSVVPPDSTVAHLVARTPTEGAVGCGTLVDVDDGVVELVDFTVRYDVRGRHAGETLLRALEAVAAANGAGAVVVETSSTTPDASAFWIASGYRRIAPWGAYRDSATSVCFSKLLPATTGVD